MRIISGKNKGKILSTFKLETTRPTSDMVKQALFNIIGEDIDNAVFLDLFAGTGAVGLESVSRNCKFVYFVDCNKESVQLVSKNAKLINANNIQISNVNYDVFLKMAVKNSIKFDIVFIDPPYKSDFAEKAVEFIVKNELINNGGLLFWEHDIAKLNILNNYGNFTTKKYGIKYLSYFRVE